jgi:hypothetical protein
MPSFAWPAQRASGITGIDLVVGGTLANLYTLED